MSRNFVLLCALAGLLGGCSQLIVGRWEAASETGGAEGKFRFARVQFTRDGKFIAEEALADSRHEAEGTYQFTGLELIVRTDSGERRYGAIYNAFNDTLTVTDRASGKSVTMKRVGNKQ